MRADERPSARKHLLFVLLAAVLSGLCAWVLKPSQTIVDPTAPGVHQSEGYVGSAECKSCHPGAYDSWSHSYHKSMTRSAAILTDGEVDDLPRFPISLSAEDREFKLFLAAGRVRVQGPDLHEVGQALAQINATTETSRDWRQQKAKQSWADAKTVTRNIVLVTGSHHYLALWVSGQEGAALRQLPLVFLLDEQRWIPRKEAFLQPPDAMPHIARFNANCIMCHAVAGRPRQTEGNDEVTGEFWERYNSDVADLGIACEACHGPGRQHASALRSPFARLLSRRDRQKQTLDKQPPHMFIPQAKNAELSSAACGQCHSYFLPSDPDAWWSSGFTQNFKAGSDLTASRQIMHSPQLSEQGIRGDDEAPRLSVEPADLFWQDGSIMVGGREYNGLVESPCYKFGEGDNQMSCVSCHSMHSGDPVGQLSPLFTGENSNKMCTQCHSTAAGHARHESDSPGALCVNCHMPKTSYALLSGIRSHHITSPTRLPSQNTKRDAPVACVLCHTDRNAQWLETEIPRFSSGSIDAPTAALSPSQIPWAVENAMTGNAAIRAILLSALASPEALKTAGRLPFELVINELLDDEYAAIAHMARRAQQQVERSAPASVPGAQVKIAVSRRQIKELRVLRDHSPIVISE